MELKQYDAVLSFPVIVNSWEAMGFRDTISDKDRIEEIKGAIAAINKFISTLNTEIAGKSIDEIVRIAERKSLKDQMNVNTRKDMIVAKYKRDILNELIMMGERQGTYEEPEQDEETYQTIVPDQFY